jgi:hypothetical protein
MQRQKIYLKMKDLKEALEIFFTAFDPKPILEAEDIPLEELPQSLCLQSFHHLLIILQQWME